MNNGSYGMYFHNSAIDVSSCSVSDNGADGMYMHSSGSLIGNCEIFNNGSSGIYCNGSSYNITNCQIENNGGWAAKLDNSTLQNYSGNSGSGNGYDAFSMYGAIGQDLNFGAVSIGFPIVVNGNLVINNGNTLTFPPGEIIKLSNGNIQVNKVQFIFMGIPMAIYKTASSKKAFIRRYYL